MTTTMPTADQIMSEGWLLDEDYALKQKLKGMGVTDQAAQKTNGRMVDVWFNHPDQEIREQTYPYITIDLLDVNEAQERVHRGTLWIGEKYGVQMPPPWWEYEDLRPAEGGYLTEMPTPINLDYQISTWARNPRHDRQMMTQLMAGGRTMLRAGWLEVGDNTIRRMDWMGMSKRTIVDENNKRLFNNVIRVRISSEIPFYPIAYRWQFVESVHMKFPTYRRPNDWGNSVPPQETVEVVLRPDDTDAAQLPSVRSTKKET